MDINCKTTPTKKKKYQPNTWIKNIEKKQRYGRLHPLPLTCTHNTKTLKCATLSHNDMNVFNAALYYNAEQNYQHAFLARYMQMSAIKRRRNNGKYSPKKFRAKYSVFNADSTPVPVCFQAFMRITRYKKCTLTNILNTCTNRDGVLEDKRGGFRKRQQYDLIKDSILEFVSRLHYVESHYCRGRTEKKYLSSELNLTRLFEMYLEVIKDNPPFPPDSGISVKLSYFCHVVQTECNISFKMPQTDQCSTCLQYKERIMKWPKEDVESEEYVLIRAEYAIHKKRAKAYYKILKSFDPEVYMCSYDCQKNQPLPKLPDGATYYSRQIYYQNFCIVSGNSHVNLDPSTVSSYCWTENEYNRNSNLISSCVLHHLRSIEDWSSFKSVTFVSDGCTSQNKNSAMLAMTAYWLLNEAPEKIDEVQLVFPVTGHSFLPPDRVFAQIEKKAKRIETIETVQEFDEVVRQFSTLRNVADEVRVYDFKTASSVMCKTPAQLHFAISKCKRIFVCRDPNKADNILVRGELYNEMDTAKYASLFKARKNGKSLILTEVPVKNSVSKEKKKDVDALLKKHYGENWRSNDKLNFYAYVLDAITIEEPEPNTNADRQPEALCEQQEPDPIEELVV